MLTKNRLACSALVLAGGLFAAGALAGGNGNDGNESHQKATETGQPTGNVHGITFDELDEDRDGYISNAEFRTTKLSEQVDHEALDVDDDGRLNRTEFAAFEMMSQDTRGEPTDRTEPRRTADEPFQASDPTRDQGTTEPER